MSAAHPHSKAAFRKLALSDVLLAARDYLADGPLSFHARAVLAKMALCRSGEYGYAKLACADCGHEEWRPRGCGLRHCPSCGQTRAETWIKERKLDMLDCPYFQLVFSLPPALNNLARTNQARIYKLFLDAVRETLVELAADPKHLGGIPQILLALHTWNGALEFFLHIHAIMAGGAYDPDQNRWIPSKNPDYLFPVKVLSLLVRGKFLQELKRLYANGLLNLEPEPVKHLQKPATFAAFIDQLYETPFYSYVEKTVAGPDLVVEYLGHYLQRAGLSNRRIVCLDNGKVTFLCKDRKKKRSTTGYYARTLPVGEFVALYAQHILPRGFHRVRFAGLWSGHYKKLLPQAREAVRHWLEENPAKTPPRRRSVPKPRAPEPCPACKTGHLEHDDSVIFSVDWRRFLAGLPRGPPRPLLPRGRPT